MRHRAANPNLYLSMCHLFRRSVCFLERIDRIRSFKGKLGEVFASSSPLTICAGLLRIVLVLQKVHSDRFNSGFPVICSQKEGQALVWDGASQECFNRLQEAIMTAPLLSLLDDGATYVLDCDESDAGISAITSQPGASR